MLRVEIHRKIIAADFLIKIIEGSLSSRGAVDPATAGETEGFGLVYNRF